MDLYTKYEVSILNGFGDIFDEKVLRNYGRTDGRTDGTTDRCKPVYPPFFQSGGIKMQLYLHNVDVCVRVCVWRGGGSAPKQYASLYQLR